MRTILRRFVFTVATLVTLIALLYAEEDWRGARAWRQAQADVLAAGESLDYSHFIPPAIPASENFAAIPFFAQQRDPKTGLLEPVAIEKALLTKADNLQLDTPGAGWQRGETTDANKLRQYALASFTTAFVHTPPPASPLAQYEAIYPFIADLRAASLSRTRCRFDFDYAHPLVLERSLMLITRQIAVAKILALDGRIALADHRPDEALGDLRVILLIQSGLERDPSIVAGLVGIGLGAIGEAIFTDGLEQHAWTDAQLVQTQEQFAKIDFLATGRMEIAGDLAAHVHDLPAMRLTYRQINRQNLRVDAEDHRILNFPLPWPDGWLDLGLARLVRFALELQKVSDSRKHRVYPGQNITLERERQSSLLGGRYILPWDFIYFESSMSAVWYAPQAARGQAWVDQTIIACAIERFRLAKGHWPASLGELQPLYLAAIPHDFMNGEPYHYHLSADGSYLLYSVGWDGHDDGGKLVFREDNRPVHSIDYDKGDWPWFGPK